jgi:hypothetical protein
MRSKNCSSWFRDALSYSALLLALAAVCSVRELDCFQLSLASLQAAQSGPQPPCGEESIPPYPVLDDSAIVKSWNKSDFGRDWRPPACTGWAAVAVSVADCWHCAKWDSISSVSMSSWMFDEEASQEKIRQSDTCQRQERNGEAAPGNVRTRRRNRSSRWAKGAGQTRKRQTAVGSASSSAARTGKRYRILVESCIMKSCLSREPVYSAGNEWPLWTPFDEGDSARRGHDAAVAILL